MLTHRVGTVAIRQIPRCLMSCAEFSLGLQFSLHHFDHSTRALTHNWKSSPHVENSNTLLLVAKYDVPSVQFMLISAREYDATLLAFQDGSSIGLRLQSSGPSIVTTL